MTRILVDTTDGPEQGPLRSRSAEESFETRLIGSLSDLPPAEAWLDHEAILYVTQADHRSQQGRIVPLGSVCWAERTEGLLRLYLRAGDTIVLDGRAWCVPVPEAPRHLYDEPPFVYQPA